MARATSRARRHLLAIERRLDALERHIRALENLRSMLRTGRSRLLVVDHDRLAGIITTKDLLDFISLEGEVAQ
jgi:CBS domain-containing protein